MVNTHMTVKFLQSIAGSEFSYAPGQTADIDDDLSDAWIASGICEAVAREPSKPKITKKA